MPRSHSTCACLLDNAEMLPSTLQHAYKAVCTQRHCTSPRQQKMLPPAFLYLLKTTRVRFSVTARLLGNKRRFLLRFCTY
ncbi:hypothetical protein NDU88_006801 [Pleurodeles waltl]|uniref:Uncharacterized protein n=1 Tax=Pleurodeles waltl TaxID=8319 RepID=A0AAV7MDA3_PLEWA|nr:hypothetical protein NDU88_006801 [Pleurodeles waltl]